jgi:hypothetical protein
MPVVVCEAKSWYVAEARTVPTYASTSNATLDVVEAIPAHRPAILAESAMGVQDSAWRFTTVNIEANVVGSHRAVLPVRRMMGLPMG